MKKKIFPLFLSIGLTGLFMVMSIFMVFAQEEEPVTITVPELIIEQIDAQQDAAGYAVYDLGDVVYMHTPLQQAALQDDIENIKAYGEGLEENSKPQGVLLRWTYAGDIPETFTISLSVHEDMSDAVIYLCETSVPEAKVFLHDNSQGNR